MACCPKCSTLTVADRNAIRDAMKQHRPLIAADSLELPPRPPLQSPPAHPGLVQYSITWNGSPDRPLLTPRAGGYWTPWHIAANLLDRQKPETQRLMHVKAVSEQPWLEDGWCDDMGM